MLNSPWIRKPNFTQAPVLDYDSYWNFRGWTLNKTLKSREEIMLSLIPTGSKVLDIGCGNSLLPIKLQEKGCAVSVADVSPLVLQEYDQYGIQGILLDLEDIKSDILSGASFDYIILSEVLEHIRFPEQVILALKSHTENFLITVPNSASYQFRYGLMFRGRFFTQWVHHPSEHLRFWSHLDFLDWIKAMDLILTTTVVADGFTVRGLLPFLPQVWKNFFGFRMVYLCKVNR